VAPFLGKTQRVQAPHQGIVLDWSQHHVLYTNGASLAALAASQRDPRAYYNYLAITRRMQALTAARVSTSTAARAGGEEAKRNPESAPPKGVDWAVRLGGPTAAAQYPAKFTFDINATPDCTNDFAVFTSNVIGTAARANIAAFNNLYSGTVPTTGICGAGAATVYWAYRVGTAALPNSPSLSLDGKKVAFIENTNPPTFHVLTWTAGQGTVTAPATPTVAQLASVALTGATADLISSPFMDYGNDVAYVGSSTGLLFKITGVFNGTPALAGAPWPLTAGAGALSGPVLDFMTGNIFVGSADGHLYGFTTAGAALTNSPLLVGNGTVRGGISDPPLVDVLNGLIYVGTGNNGATSVVVQANTTNFLPTRTAPIGNRNVVVVRAGAFNDAYFSQPTNMIGTTSEWFLYACGPTTAAAASAPVLYRVGFSTSRVMNTSPDATQVALSATNLDLCSPLTEFKNGVDHLFLGLTLSLQIRAYDISTALVPAQSATPVGESNGTSGIIIDNVSAANQASSVYFTTLGNSVACGGNKCAVKLTQGGLQ
jgi:hypothetical protein